MASSYVSRINQIDAASLDQEIYKVLRSQAKRVTEYQPIEKIDRWQPEIDAILKYCIWHFSLRHGKSTFGQQLVNLHYENITGAKSILYLILTIGPAYARDKLCERGGAGSRYTRYVERFANAVQLLEFVNSLIFLNRGIQPRVIEYLLGIASRSTSTQKPRNIGYSYMTRELLWHGLMELFTVCLPMLNFHYLKHATRRLFAYAKRRADARRTPPTMDPGTNCAYCADTPILPVHAGCEHLFCYYCLAAHFAAMDQFRCFRCDAPLCARNLTTYQPPSSPTATGIP
ncbi:unnamed protein product [Xylocopa violacea]|uniref:RING-type E3 ubiquitin transferase (cysteine targeting) n=1 Tax=Xylocopa violacea TaxID=135666 RepID=A0ABP1P450_XYLVO